MRFEISSLNNLRYESVDKSSIYTWNIYTHRFMHIWFIHTVWIRGSFSPCWIPRQHVFCPISLPSPTPEPGFPGSFILLKRSFSFSLSSRAAHRSWTDCWSFLCYCNVFTLKYKNDFYCDLVLHIKIRIEQETKTIELPFLFQYCGNWSFFLVVGLRSGSHTLSTDSKTVALPFFK